ncbi:MAG TPA: hypothetical protein VIG24_12340 [Acidimicrobiia bacterium]
MTRYQVASNRLPWSLGTTVDGDDLASVNIDALVAGGHLVRAVDTSRKGKTRKAEPEPEPEPIVKPEPVEVDADAGTFTVDNEEQS